MEGKFLNNFAAYHVSSNKFKDTLPGQDFHSHLLFKPDGQVLRSF